MKFTVVVLFAILAGTMSAPTDFEPESSYKKIFGRTTDLSGRPHKLLSAKKVNFSDDCDDGLVQRVVEFSEVK